MIWFTKQLSLAAITAYVTAQSADDIANYPIIARMMDDWKATWAPYEVVTEDGYHLKIFRITGFTDTGSIEITKPPLLAVHPLANNAEFWINRLFHPTGSSSIIELAKDGYDVWLGN